MTRALCLLTAVALGATAPAVAGDMLYPGGTTLTEALKGKPYWAVQARCAGLYGATSTFLAGKGDPGGAEEAKAMGLAFLNIAVDRVMKDRGVERRTALEALSPGVIAGRQEAIEVLRAEGDGPSSKWNYARSVCLDIRDSYGAP